MKHLTLFELHQFIQRVFYLNFEESVWIEAEIAEGREHNGHVYLTLVDKDPNGQIRAKASCSLWRNKVTQLRRTLGHLYPQVVKAGNKVKVKCSVEFHPRYGYSLHADDFDPAYTEGFLFLEKKKTIERLKKEGIFDLNKALSLPLVVNRIAVISSPTAAGYQDFMHQLTGNPYEYTYSTELFSSAMQGDKVQDQFVAALNHIIQRKEEFDVIVVVRGGGASIDLSDFDDYKVAAAIAQSPLPVLAGIGHERDTSVVDMVAFARVKTPTAAAEMLIDINFQYENNIREIHRKLQEIVTRKVQVLKQDLMYTRQTMTHLAKSHLRNEMFLLEKLRHSLYHVTNDVIQKELFFLHEMNIWITQNNPIHIMQKGYAMVYQKHYRIMNLNAIDKEQPVLLIMDQQNITINEKSETT